ncbi:T9SS type A sorting domain-containing protein [Chryseobacterium sp. CFBP8996]|uniref:T9SS type A sorting domain-containing protein n=1 Tax=Chryseobacterium sp. CFBP8996 TaxID=3096529 RepID=UPI002A69F443|nr:T9SS type A sorting domain-containing protein [Chryseobacterium sp. CFBP8996]MDY0930394.1 T9SS type A sorting domain-containing protein [Chryseobacterium sp. CFBP8996]
MLLDNIKVTSTNTLATADIVKKQTYFSPNPTSDFLNIKTDSKINSVSVVDITGKKVNVKLDGDKVDVRSLPAGAYLINVETKDGISTEKFIKK